MVLPRIARDARLFRSVDRWCGDAVDYHDRIDGVSVCRFKSARQWLLHVEAETVRGEHVRVGIPDVDSPDLHRNIYPRAGLDLVLAGSDLGSQHGGVRSQPRPARDCRGHSRSWNSQYQLGRQSDLWRDRGRHVLHHRRAVLSLADEAWAAKTGLSAITKETDRVGARTGSVRREAARQHQLASVCDVPILRDQRTARDAGETVSATRIYDQVRLGNSLVQHLIECSTSF